jgi:hypothetical protein
MWTKNIPGEQNCLKGRKSRIGEGKGFFICKCTSLSK